jgi:hypothetical protein
MHDSQERRAWNITGQAADRTSLEVDLEGIAETLVHECNSAVVRRNIRALSEMGQDFDLGREMFKRITRFPLGERGRGEEKASESKWPNFHRGESMI